MSASTSSTDKTSECSGSLHNLVRPVNARSGTLGDPALDRSADRLRRMVAFRCCSRPTRSSIATCRAGRRCSTASPSSATTRTTWPRSTGPTGGDDRGQYRLYTHYLTAALVALAVVAHARFWLVPWLFTTYVMWSPWHYTGQNFGLLMMFLRRAGIDVSAERAPAAARGLRRVVRDAAGRVQHRAVARSARAVARAAQSRRADDRDRRRPRVPRRAALAAFVSLARSAPSGALLPPLTLYSTQALWFVLPIALSWMSSIAAPQTRYSSGMIAVMHSAQYLWITQVLCARDAEQAPAPTAGAPWRYWATLVIGGIALFLPVPWLASYGWHSTSPPASSSSRRSSTSITS